MKVLAVTVRGRLARLMEIVHLLLALVIVAAAWVLVTQLLTIGTRNGVSNDQVSHSD